MNDKLLRVIDFLRVLLCWVLLGISTVVYVFVDGGRGADVVVIGMGLPIYFMLMHNEVEFSSFFGQRPYNGALGAVYRVLPLAFLFMLIWSTWAVYLAS
jgi:hypothetical protein